MKSQLLFFFCLATLIHAADLDEKSARYHAMLLKKPETTTLLSRFLDAWLETSDQPALLDFLQKRTTSGTAADWRVLAAFHEFTGNDAAALAALDSAVKLAPDDSSTRLARAKILAKLFSIEPALADLKLAAKDPALHLDATTLTGRLLAQAGRPEEALKAWDALLAAHPDDLGLHEDLIDLLLQENLADQAIAASRKLTDLTKDPYQKAIRRLRTAEILTLAGKATDAATEYAAILELSAQDSWLERETLALTQKLFASGQNPTAWKKFLTTAIVAAPTRTNLHLALAQLHLSSGETDEALKIHKQLLQTHPGSLPIRQAYIAILQQSGQVQQAAAELQLLADKSPDDPAIWQQLATIHQTSGDTVKLQQALDKIIALLPKDATAPIQTAQLYEQFQQPEKARKILEAAAESQGPQSDAADAFANFLARHQGLDQAVALWTTVAKTADRENLLRISRALAANGKAAEAHAVLAARIKDFAADPLLLSALCQAALITDQAAATIPHALALLDLSQTPTETQAAVALTTTLVHRAQLDQQTIDQLAAAPNLSTQRLCLLAQLHESLGDSLSAQKTLKQAAANDPNHTALYQQIALHETRGDLPAAIRTLQELIAIPGNRKPPLLKQLAALQRRAGNLTDAVATAVEWKTLAPGDKSPFMTLAELQTELGDPQKATAELRRATAKFGNDAELRDKLIQSLLNSGSHAEALRLQLQLLDEADSLAAKLKCVPRVAETARILGRDQEIEELFRKRIRENPTATGPVLALRELFNAWQRQPEANELLAQAARLAPDDLDLQEQFANQLETAGQIDQAESLLLGLHQQHPTQESLRKLSSFYLRTGDDEKAADLTRQAALQTTDPRQLETFVLAIFQAGNWQAALDVLTAAKPDVTSDWRLTYLRGVALEQLGQTDAALKVFVPLLLTQTELTNLSKPQLPKNSPDPYNPYSSGRRYRITDNLSPEQQAINDFTQAMQTAYPLDPNTGYRSYSGFRPAPSGRPVAYQLTLPADARSLRLHALVHGLKIAIGTPVDQRPAILAQLSLPELKFLPGLLKIIALGESDSLDTLLAASPDDVSLATACLNIDTFYNFLSLVAPVKSGRYQRSNPRFQNIYNIKPATWELVIEKLQSTHPAIALAASFRSGAFSNSSPDAVKKSAAIILGAYRALPANERKSSTHTLLSYTYNFRRNPANAAATDELYTTLTKDLDPSDPYLLQSANADLCAKIQTAALAGDYAAAVTHSNEFIANTRASSKANAAKYGNQMYSPYGYGGYGGYGRYSGYGGAEIPKVTSHWEFAYSLNFYNTLLHTASSQGCSFLLTFKRRESEYQNPRISQPVTPALAALLKELGATIPEQKTTPKPTANPAAVPTFTVTDKPAFLAALEKLSDPLLRLIILDALKFEPEVRAAIVSLTDPSANPDVNLLLWSSAYLAARPADLVMAYQLAVRAQAAKPDPALAPVAENQLLAIALKLDEKSRAAVDLDPARSLALRRAKSITEESYRKAFAVHLTTLGLKDAAARLTQPASPIAIARRVALSQGSSYSASRTATATAATLVRQGNRPAAARLLYRQMVNELRANNNNYSGSSSAVQQATQLQLAPDIAEAMRPPATASFARRAEFVKILCRFAPLADFRADLEKLHEEKPNDIEILSLYCAVADPAKNAGLFKILAAQPDNDLSELGGKLLMREGDSPRTMEAIQAYLNRWAAVVTLLDAIPAGQSSRKNLTWVNHHALQLATGNAISYFSISQDSSSVYIPKYGIQPEKLRDGASARDKERHAAIEKVSKLRDDSLRAVATAMLKHPGTASQGFELLYAGRATLGLDDEALYPLAMDSLCAALPVDLAEDPDAEIKAAYPAQYRRWAIFNQGSYNNNSYSMPGGTLPETFLAKHAASHPDLDILASLLAKLPEATSNQIKPWSAFFAKPTAAEAATRLKQIQSDPAQLRIFLAVSPLANLARSDASAAIDLLFAAIDPKSLVTPQLNSEISYRRSPNSGANNAIISRWLNTPDLSKRWARLHQFATIILGPERHWPAYASVNLQFTDDASQPARARLAILNSYFTPEDNGQRIRNFLPQRFLRTYKLPNNNNSWINEISNMLESSENETPDRCREKIDQILATNLFLPGPGLMKEDGSFLPMDLIRTNQEKFVKVVGEALMKVTGPNRFWATLTGSIVMKQDSAAFLPLLQQELPSIKKWPDTEQVAFASFLTATWPDLEKSTAASWLATNTRKATKLLATRLKESIQSCRDGRNYDSRDEIFNQTIALLRRDPESIVAIWNDALAHEAKNPPVQGNASMGGSPGSARFTRVEEAYAQMVSNLSYNSNGLPPITTLRCLLSLSKTPAHRALAIRKPDLNSRNSSLFSQVIQNRKSPLPAKWQSLKDIPAACIIPVFDMITDQDLADFPGLFQQLGELDSYINVPNIKALEALEPWLKQELEPKKPLCAKLARFMLAYGFARRGSSSDAKATSSPMVEAANALLLDPVIKDASRLNILYKVVSYQSAVALSNPDFLAHVMTWAKDTTAQTDDSLQSSISLIQMIGGSKSLPPELAAQLINVNIPAILKTAATGSSYASCQERIVPTWLNLARQSRDKKAIEAAVAANLSTLVGRYNHITQFALDGYPDIAATLIPKPHEISLLEYNYLDSGGYRATKFSFTKSLEAALPALLAAIPDPQQRYRVECLMNIYYETTNAAEKPVVPRADRISKLVARFATDAPPHPQAKLEILCAIASGLNDDLTKELRALCGNLQIGDLLELRHQLRNSSSNTADLQLINFKVSAIDSLISLDLDAGNASTFFRQAQGLLQVNENSKYSSRNHLNAFSQNNCPRSLAIILHAPPDKRAGLLKQAADLTVGAVAQMENGDNSAFALWRLYLILAHAAAGQGPALEPWWQAQSAAFKKAIPLRSDDASNSVLQSRMYAYSNWKGKPFAIKDHPQAGAELLSTLFADPVLSKLEIVKKSDFTSYINSGCFSRENIHAAIDAVPDTAARKPESLA